MSESGPQGMEQFVDVEEREVAEWVHFVREWRAALASPASEDVDGTT